MNYLTRIAPDDERSLLQTDWQLDGWRYAWIRSVEKSRRRLLAAARAFDATLFAVESDRQRRYVARIDGVECISAAHAEAVRSIATEHGWLARPAAGGEPEGSFFNVRFRPGRLHRYPAGTYATPDDPVMHLNRFQLHGTSAPAGVPALPSGPERDAMRARLVAEL